MQVRFGDKVRWIAAAAFSAWPTLQLLIGLLSGSIFRDANAASENSIWFVRMLPAGMNLALFVIAAGLLLYGPIMRNYAKLERSLLRIKDTPHEPAAPPTRPPEPSKAEERFDPYLTVPHTKSPPTLLLGWKDDTPSAIGSAPGQIGSAPLVEVLITRQRIRDGKLAVQGIGKYSFPEPVKCPLCHGKGTRWGRYEGMCWQCHGTGELPGELIQYPRCKPCNGTGHREARYEAECPVCGGLGVRGVEPELFDLLKPKSTEE